MQFEKGTLVIRKGDNRENPRKYVVAFQLGQEVRCQPDEWNGWWFPSTFRPDEIVAIEGTPKYAVIC